jgi:hypothetical protein
VNEDQLLTEILKLAEENNILVHHCRDSRKCDGNGLPDLILVGKTNILLVELKSAYGELSSAQNIWRYRIIAAGGYWVCWRPEDLPRARWVLRGL